MIDSAILDKTSASLGSTQEALNILRNLRQKRKKESPASLYELVKQIYNSLRDPTHKKGLAADTISSDEYLGNNRESIEDMLLYIKEKTNQGILAYSSTSAATGNTLTNAQSRLIKLTSIQQICSTFGGEHKGAHFEDEVSQLNQTLKQKQEKVRQLNQMIRYSEHQSKSIQIKLLNNIKRLNTQMQQKDAELREVKLILANKEQQIDELNKLNEKKHKKIRKLEEDLYDLQLELEQKNEELEAQRECADFLQKKIEKVLQIQSQFSQISQSMQQKQQICEENDYKSQIGIQTDESNSISDSGKQNQGAMAVENRKQNENENQNEDKVSRRISIITQSKQSKYIESIQRLTAELGEAYQRINELMKQGGSDASKAIELQYFRDARLGARGKQGKHKTKSGHLSKFWQ